MILCLFLSVASLACAVQSGPGACARMLARVSKSYERTRYRFIYIEGIFSILCWKCGPGDLFRGFCSGDRLTVQRFQGSMFLFVEIISPLAEARKASKNVCAPQMRPNLLGQLIEITGGGGGSRTRVRKLSARSIYVRSRCFDSRSLRLSAARFRGSQLMCFRLPPISLSGKLSRKVDAPFQPYRRKLEGTATVN